MASMRKQMINGLHQHTTTGLVRELKLREDITESQAIELILMAELILTRFTDENDPWKDILGEDE